MIKSILIAVLAVFMIGCGDNSSSEVKVNNTKGQNAGAFVIFDSTAGNIPYPNNILFAKADGTVGSTLNLPYNPEDSDAVVKQQLNTLDGFSTTSPITIGFNGSINPSTLFKGLHFYEMNATGIAREISFYVAGLQAGEFVATTSGNKIVILPVKPLKQNTNYAVALTKAITDDANKSLAPDLASALLLKTTPLYDTTNHTSLSDADAQKFEGIRQASQQVIGAILQSTSNTLSREEIVSAWSFKTQSIGKVTTAISDANISATMSIQDTHLTAQQIIGSTGADVSSMKGNAEVYAGTLSQLPYYLAKASSTHDTAPLTKSFTFAANSSLPDVNATITIPVLVTIPKATNISMPATGWPVVIFQHGITQNRTNLLAISEAFASVGYAAVAIDLPLHGIDDNTSGLYIAGIERTFDLDLINNTTGASGPDGKIDPSGTYYINLKSLLTSRDNIKQTTSDLIALKNSFGNIVSTDGVKFDPNRVAFVGHSLGTIAPFGFLAHANNLESVTLAMPGGGIAQLLNNSVSFGPKIEAGLADAGVIKGTSSYDSFMLATQTILDSADPINYALQVGETQKVFAIEVVGGNGELSDQVIPNSVATAPLSGTDPLLTYLQASTLSGHNGDNITPNKTARYNVGDHSSILDPSASVDATVSMQTQTATFVGSRGTAIPIVNSDLLNMTYPQ